MSMKEATPLDTTTIVVDVRDGKAMSVYRVPKSGMLVFKNASKSKLVVTPKDGDEPFCELNGETNICPVVVPADSERAVRICKNFEKKEVVYTAAIDGAVSDDPIVIID